MIWVTRTQPAADDSVARLRAMGRRSIAVPLLEISPPPHMPFIPPKRAVLVITSKNGISAVASLTDYRGWPVITTGDASAEFARTLGFHSVASAGGTSADVTRLVKRTIAKTTPVIHMAGTHIRGRIIEDLCAHGYKARRNILYASEAVIRWPKINFAEITHIVFYSPKAAACFTRFNKDASHVTAVSISTATDEALGDCVFLNRFIAAEPTQEALFSRL